MEKDERIGPKIIKVDCSFCGRQIECPEDMKDSEKHACFECFKEVGKNFSEKDIISGKIHVDIPEDEITPEMLVDFLVEDMFPEVWKENKAELKELPRRELALKMFAAGAGVMIDALMQMGKEDEEDAAEEK